LWSLLNFILPEIFDSLDNFKSWFDLDHVISSADVPTRSKEEVIKTDNENDENGLMIEKDTFKETGMLIGKLHAILQPFLLRRLKMNIFSASSGSSMIPKKVWMIILSYSLLLLSMSTS